MRTIYGITARGRRRFQELLCEQFEADGPVAQTLYGAMLFLHLADLPAGAARLRRKIIQQTEAIREVSVLRKRLAPVLSTGGRHLTAHLSLQRRLDRKWLQAVLADVDAGNVRDVPDPRRLAAQE